MLTGMNALPTDRFRGQDRLSCVRYGVSDYEFLIMGDNKTRPNNWCRQFARKSVQATIRFVIIPFMTLL